MADQHPQPGILALGTSDHLYLELDLHSPGAAPGALAAAAGLVEQLSTTNGVNVVVGVRPSVWAAAADATDVPESAADWTDDLVGPDGFTMPATQHDLWLWVAGGARTAVFDCGRQAVAALAPFADVATEITGWLYRHDRDLTGFIDGTENPSQMEAPSVVAVPSGRPGAGSGVLLFQKWPHDTAAWEGASTDRQEHVMGRTKPDSVQFPDDTMPADAHVARTTLVVDGEEQHIFRRNVAYGDLGEHGTVFVGFSLDQWRLAEMLRRMAGIPDGVRCALTRYTKPVTGAYYVVPSVDALARWAPPDPDD